MRSGRFWVALAACLVLVAGLWALWPVTSTSAAPPQSPKEGPKKVVQASALPPVAEGDDFDPGLYAEAARGELGLPMRNRVCALCDAGGLDDAESCRECRKVATAGRVNLDVVGSDGRPLGDHEVMVRASCGGHFRMKSEFMDLPEGPCELSAVRVDGPFNVSGPPVQMTVVPGEEAYALLEIPSEPWGGVGVTLRTTEDGVGVEGLLPMASGEIPEGAIVLAIDGEAVEDAAPAEVGERLAGPVGSEVEVRFAVPGEDGLNEQTILVERQRIEASEVSITAGAPG